MQELSVPPSNDTLRELHGGAIDMSVGIDFIGAVERVKLRGRHSLWPLFEAVVNSMYAIKETHPSGGGSITICVTRDKSQPNLDIDHGRASLYPIKGFTITDNGAGFTSAHYKSFELVYTREKRLQGGKGIGRLTWLKAFERTRITSAFKEDDSHYIRHFTFALPEGTSEHDCRLSDGAEPLETEITLDNYLEPYKSNCPKQLEVIADRIAAHCFPFFMDSACPQVVLYDGDKQESRVSVNGRIGRFERDHSEFNVRNKEQFRLINLRLDSGSKDRQLINYCAHNRVVKTRNTKKLIPDVAVGLQTPTGDSFTYAGYVFGDWLDNSANDERTGLMAEEDEDDDDELDLFEEVHWREVIAESVRAAERFLAPFTAKVAAAKFDSIRQFVEKKAYWYKYLLKYPEDLKVIPPGASEQDMDVHLHRLDAERGQRNRECAQSIINSTAETLHELKQSDYVAKVIGQINEREQSKLTEHVIERRYILDLLSKCLRPGDDDKYAPEAAIHNLIYPMGATSDSAPVTQNLWVIDERLSYHSYLASNRSLPMTSVTQSNRRPDISILFDNTFCFAECLQQRYLSYVLIEFKKPERDDYYSDDPIKQVVREIEIIRDSQKMTDDGMRINYIDGTPIYCYIYATLTPTLRKAITRQGFFKPMPDKMGYVGYHNFDAWIEVIDYSKLIGDATARSRILFDKLGLTVY